MKRIGAALVLSLALLCLPGCQSGGGYTERFARYEYGGELDVSDSDRHLVLEDVPENIPEGLVAQQYEAEVLRDYERLAGLYGENEALQISAANTKKNDEEGIYMREYVIHSLSVLKEEALGEYAFAQTYLKDVEKFALTDYAVVKADLTWAWSQVGLDSGPQVGDGRYDRFYLCGKRRGGDWKIYEVYWY